MVPDRANIMIYFIERLKILYVILDSVIKYNSKIIIIYGEYKLGS